MKIDVGIKSTEGVPLLKNEIEIVDAFALSKILGEHAGGKCDTRSRDRYPEIEADSRCGKHKVVFTFNQEDGSLKGMEVLDEN